MSATARAEHAAQRSLVTLAQKVVRGAVAFMAVTTVAATAVGFWLSYAGLHVFAYRAGLRGPEAWAWPASVDLFILAGELGITVSAIRGQRDWLAWCYLLAGFGPSVAFNVLHVATITPAWGRYAVAAVPPVAAMLALAALMRQVFRLAAEAHLAAGSGSVPGDRPVTTPAGTADEAAVLAYRASVAGGNPLSERALADRFGITRPRARKLRAELAAGSNGHAPAQTPASTDETSRT
jgi:hypothetical protein